MCIRDSYYNYALCAGAAAPNTTATAVINKGSGDILFTAALLTTIVTTILYSYCYYQLCYEGHCHKYSRQKSKAQPVNYSKERPLKQQLLHHVCHDNKYTGHCYSILV